MKLSVSAFRGAQASARKKLFSNTNAVPYHRGGSGNFSQSVIPISTTASLSSQLMPNFPSGAQMSARKKPFSNTNAFPYYSGDSGNVSKSVIPVSTTASSPLPIHPSTQVANDEMPANSTNVGPGTTSESLLSAGEERDTIAAQGTASPIIDTRRNDPIASTTATAKCSECVDQRAYQKNQRTRSNQRWMKLRTTVQLSGAISSTIQKSKAHLKREDSFLKRFSTRQMPEMQETLDTGDDGEGSSSQGEPETLRALRRRKRQHRKRQPSTVVNPDENFYFYWLFLVTVSVLYNLWTLIVRQSFPEFQRLAETLWATCDHLTDLVFLLDIVVQFRTGYLEQGLVVYDSKKLALHYVKSRSFIFDLVALLPLQLLQRSSTACPILRFPCFFKTYRVYNYYYMVESRTVYPNLWRVANLIHILLILAHWFGCFYYLLSEAEKFKGDWVFPNNSAGYNTLTRKYLGSLYWSTLTLTTIGDLPTPETDADRGNNTNGTTSTKRRRYKKSRILQFRSDTGFVFTIVSYLIGVFIFATIVGQVGNVITNRNANRLEFERLLDGAKTYMRHHKVPNGMKRRVLRWYDYSWARGRIQGGGDINTALGLLPDKLKTELALHVNLSVLKKVTIFQECQPEFLHDLVLKMKAFIYTPGDLICRKGEVAREMFIIADGILEVISDTGHVLTTMMAGDFFGEIGILNLDGLNKRTADVRSVGYSELFSLSREDVLAAMKDYPEAQEILQSLGRKRLMEARSISRAINEQKNAKLNAAGTNAVRTSDNRARNKIVEKLCSDVKGLKSVLRKSRRGTKGEDSLELEPLTSICGQTETQFSIGTKGTLCRMQKVTSDEHWPPEDDSASLQPSERRISAGFPLLSKLKTFTDKQQQQRLNQRQPTLLHRQPTSNPTSCAIDPSDRFPLQEDAVDSKPLGAGLPLLQRLLLLKQKEDAEKKACAAQPTDAVITIDPAAPKKPKNCKKEVAFADEALVAQSPPVDDRRRIGEASAGLKQELAKPWSSARRVPVDQNWDQRAAPEPNKSEAPVGCHRLNPHRTLSRLYSSAKSTTLLPVPDNGFDPHQNTGAGSDVALRTGGDARDTGGGASVIGSDDVTRSSANCAGVKPADSTSDDAGASRDDRRSLATCESKWAPPPKRRCLTSADHQSPPDPTCGRRFEIPKERHKCSRHPAKAFALRSCSLDSCAKIVGPLEAPSAGSCETLERRVLKSILKRVSFGNRRVCDILASSSVAEEIGPGECRVEGAVGRVGLLRRLMRAPTVEGFVARRSTLEKSVACDVTLGSPPAAKACFFGDCAGQEDDDNEASDDVRDYDYDPCYCASSYHQEEGHARVIESEVREKDELIRELQWKIAELRKHHEHCFQEHSNDEDADCDTLEQPFMRDDSTDTVLLSPQRSRSLPLDRESRTHTNAVRQMGRRVATRNRHSWEDRSEEENLELRELPGSMEPRPVWRNDVRIDISSTDDASETDEPHEPSSDDDLPLARHDCDWEVRMLARELDKRQADPSRASTRAGLRVPVPFGAGRPSASEMRSIHSLEEGGTDISGSSISQRSASIDVVPTSSTMVCVSPPTVAIASPPVPGSTASVQAPTLLASGFGGGSCSPCSLSPDSKS